jgi:hypothetical protein
MNFLNSFALCFALLLAWMEGGIAQSIAGVEETGIVYRKTRSMGAYIHSRGTGLSFRRGVNETGFRSAQFDFSLQTMRHPKEIRSVNPFSDNAVGYIYGKRNSIIMLRTGWGKQFILHPEGDKGGVETGFCLYGGATWALLKPVYLNVYYFDDNFGVRERTELYDPMLHYPDNISGRAPFLVGIGESRFSAGLYANAGMQFEFGRKQQNLRVLETGIAADFMARPIEIMANNPAERLFVTLYIRLMYGKLWNRNE